MKYKSFFAAAFLAIGALIFAIPAPSAAAIECPPGSLRNPNGEGYVEVPGITSVAQCNLPAEKENEGFLSRAVVIINVILGVVGFVAVVMIIMGGISFITSQGDSGKVTKAKNTVLYGIIGLVVALLAFTIVNFVLSSIFSTEKQANTGNLSPDYSNIAS